MNSVMKAKRASGMFVAVATVFVVLAASVSTSTVWGGATLNTGTGAGTPCAVGCGGGPTTITQTDFDVYQFDSGANTLTQPLLVILGIPNYTGTAKSILSVTTYDPYAGVATGGGTLTGSAFGLATTTDFFGGTWTTGTTSAEAILTAISSGDAYSVLGLAGGDGSNTFVNWAAFNAAHGVTATSFGLYVYFINANLGANDLVDIAFNGANKLPIGTFAIAYGCAPSTANNTTTCTNSDSTEFALAGGVTGTASVGPPLPPPSIPEPSVILLLGAALAAMGATRRKK